MNQRKTISLVLCFGVIAISFSAVLIRLAVAEPPVIAFYRLFFATLMLLPWAWRQSRQYTLTARHFLLAFGAGLFLALHFLLWMTSLEHTSVASSVVLVTTQPLFVFLFSVLFFQEKPKPLMWLGLFLALIGSIVVVFGQSAGGDSRLFGNALALGGAIMMASYFMVGRQLRQDLPLALYSVLVYGSSSIILALYILFVGLPWLGYSSGTWFVFILLAFVPTILGHNSMNWALKFLPPTMVSVVILGEPLGASLLAVIILKEIPTAMEILGSMATLAGIFLVWWADAYSKSAQ